MSILQPKSVYKTLLKSARNWPDQSFRKVNVRQQLIDTIKTKFRASSSDAQKDLTYALEQARAINIITSGSLEKAVLPSLRN